MRYARKRAKTLQGNFAEKIKSSTFVGAMKILQTISKIILPFILGGAILYWMYRGEDWQSIKHVMLEEMNWTWMLLSFPFGILAQMFRGWRWQQTLEPFSRNEERGTGSEVRSSVCINAIFMSYAASLVIPRAGKMGGDLLPQGAGNGGDGASS